ncbi:MAG TPA: NAD(P)/FAD-dependent oxidoreductase [Fimbriimonadaceae bacterium]
MARAKVVIIGGGFGGLKAAKVWGKAPVDVTLVDKSNHFLFQPLLYQVATATLSPGEIAMPIRHILRRQRNTEVLLGEVVDIDVTGKRVLLKDTDPILYDFLIISAGATHSYFGHPDWEQYARGLKSIDDAIYIRSKILAAFEYAERADDPTERAGWINFLIVGAGPTGVEMAGAISEISHHVLKNDFKRIKPGSAKVILIEGGSRVLSTYDQILSDKAAKSLATLQVEVRLNTTVQDIDELGVTTNTGRIEGRTVVWAAGVQASSVADWLKIDHDKAGHVRVEKDLTIKNRPGVFVIGDCATLMQDGHPLPGVAQVAIQQGKYAALAIKEELAGKPKTKAFRYKDLGSLAAIGRSSAIAQFGRVHLWGFAAWLVWLFVHIMNLVGFRAKASVLLQWAWAYFTWDRGARIITRAD